MARSFTPTEAYSIMNLLVKQATGEQAVTATDASSFVSAGELVLATGTENVLNSLSVIVGRTLIASRPYSAKLNIIDAMNTNLYTNRLRKISYYARENVSSGYFNTDQIDDNLATGNGDVDGAGSMWEQNLPVPLEMNFAGSDVWDTCTTITEGQLKIAFSDEASFMEFMSGVMTEKANDIESTKEAFNRMTILNKIAGTYDISTYCPGSIINLTAAYNTKFGTSYTSAQLRTTYLDSFLKFFVSEFKQASNYMTHRTKYYHWSPAKTVGDVSYKLLRHTPKDKQRALLYSPLFLDAQAQVLPEIFNPQYLDINNYEGVEFWQADYGANNDANASIKFTPAIPDVANAGGGQKQGSEVDLAYVVGVLYDVDGIMTDFQLESSYSTPVNARHGYRNIWWHFAKNAINDFTENCIVFTMEDV